MEVRTETLCSFFVAAVAVVSSGCGYTQQSRFQMSFLPPAPHGASAVVELPEPPPVPHNAYLGADIPAIILSNPQIIQRRMQGDATIQTAQRRFLTESATIRAATSPTRAANSTAPSI